MIPYRSSLLVAFPKQTVKQYTTEKELIAAFNDGKVEGMVRVKDPFPDYSNVKITDARKSYTRVFRVTKIDPKEGIVLEAVKTEDIKSGKEEEASAMPHAYLWIAGGLGVAAIVGFAGLWVSRRSRAA